MKSYKKVEVSEQELEDLIRRYSEYIEEGLLYVDHQKSVVGRRLDVLMVDSGKSLVVAELKVVQDDNMLLQGLDYYDYVSSHVESFARLYKKHSIDPTQQVRLVLIAPSFSQALANRCKWLSLPISLFTYSCLKHEGETEITPVFNEQDIPTAPEIIKTTTTDDILAYITDTNVRGKVRALLDEIKSWNSDCISLDATQSAISIKVNGKVFAYLHPRRQYYILSTFDEGEDWKDYKINDDGDLLKAKSLVKASLERKQQ